jgi:hypothetical protein
VSQRRASLRPSLELEILLLSGWSQDVAGRLPQLRSRIGQAVDWERLVQLASWHRMLPLLHDRLRSLGWANVPVAVAAELRREFLLNASLSLSRTGTLLDLLGALESEGIPALPYKGPALAAQVYGNVALRQVGDLDVIVRRQDALRARDLLFARGYRSLRPLKPGVAEFMVRSRYHETLCHPALAPVELHWAFTNADVAFPLELDDLLPNAREVTVGGRPIRVFGDEDQILILSVHGAKHRWSRLEWLCSFAELIRGSRTLDWDRIALRARATRIERRLLLGLHLAAEVLDAPVPDGLIEKARATPHVLALADEVRAIFWEQTRRPQDSERAASVPQDWFQIRQSDSVWDQLRLLSYRATTPTQPKDWTPVDVGHVRLPAHALLRPFQVAVRLMPALWWYVGQRRAARVARL